MIEQAKFSYFPLKKALEKQRKTIEDQGEKQIKGTEDLGKQVVESICIIKKKINIDRDAVPLAEENI